MRLYISQILLSLALLTLIPSGVIASASDLCKDGVLLFREDFGGNDPSDPRICQTPVQGMTYQQLMTDYFGVMNQGRYLVTKQGYCNGDTLPTSVWIGSQWHLQDDHTYPNDITRGYFLEIDGLGDNAVFYTTTINNVCAGTRLTFSAYVANVLAWTQYMGGKSWWYAYPKLTFRLTDPVSGVELATYTTGNIPFDSTFIGDYDGWRSSSKWHYVGMNFTVPNNGVNSITLTISNSSSGASYGNDFAIDDIEIRLCAPKPEIKADNVVCRSIAYDMHADFDNDGAFNEPLAYKWWHSADSITWNEISGAAAADLIIDEVTNDHAGWYRVAVAEKNNISSINCRSVSEPFKLSVITCDESLPEVVCSEGALLFREDFGGNDVYDRRVRIASVSGMEYSQLLTDSRGIMANSRYIVTKSGYCFGDTAISAPNRGSKWFIQDDHTHPNDYTRGYFLEVNGAYNKASIYTADISELTDSAVLFFTAYVANVHLPYYYQSGAATIYPQLKFTLTNTATGKSLKTYNTGAIPFDSAYMYRDDWSHSSAWRQVGFAYRVPVGVQNIKLNIYSLEAEGEGNDFAIDDIEIRRCDSIVPPDTIPAIPPDTIPVDTIPATPPDTTPVVYCPDVITIHHDTTICDTLMPFKWGWLQFHSAGTRMVIDEATNGCDSVLHIYTLTTKHCERPELPPPPPDTIPIAPIDTTIIAHIDTVPETPIDTIPLTPPTPPIPPDTIPVTPPTPVDTVPVTPPSPIDTLPVTPPAPKGNSTYKIIVNKYDWLLLCDNVTVAQLFPERHAIAYQWYKNDAPIEGATDDDYSEYNRLVGKFQLLLTLDNNEVIHSNIINIKESISATRRVRVYNSSGRFVAEQLCDLPSGIYFVQTELDGESQTEKVFIP